MANVNLMLDLCVYFLLFYFILWPLLSDLYAHFVIVIRSLIPRGVTGVSALSSRTGAAGHNVTVAILDSGIDPGAPGLQVTTDGQRKLVDIVDCTSSGDVNTASRLTISDDSILPGFSGRALHVPQSVVKRNKSGIYRLGLKRAYDLFPAPLVYRIKKEREDAWKRAHSDDISRNRLLIQQLKAHRASSADIDEAEARLSVLQGLSKHYRDAGPLFDCVVFHDGTKWLAIVDTSQRGRLEECDVLEDFALRGSYSTFPDGVMLNFVVKFYNDGDVLSIVVDCSSHGTHVASIFAANFPEAPHLNGLAPAARIVSLKIGDSRLAGMETHQGLTRALAYCLARSPKESKCSDSNFSPPSKHVSDPVEETESRPDSLGPSSQENTSEKTNFRESHGDSEFHVADENNSGEDAGQDQMPTITIDMINMSYGEHTRDSDKGRFVRLVNELVYKHNVIFISSAGNEGPALSSVSAPGGTTDSIIGVGAYVTPDMITQAYSYLHSDFDITHSDASPTLMDSRAFSRSSFTACQAPVMGMPYTWTSRGPSSNGGMSISVCAPGGAVAPVPVWKLQRKQLMNGTSMSSPSAAGAVAVILSFLKQKGIPYTSALVRRAIENSARPLKPMHESNRPGERASNRSSTPTLYGWSDLVFATGCGSIDALAACNYIENYMAPRKSPQASTDALPIGATARALKNPDCSEPDPHTLCGVKYAETHDNCGDSTFFLEDWHFKISIKSGSQSKRSGSVDNSYGTNGIYLRGTADTECVQRIKVVAKLTGYDTECDQTKKTLSEIEVHLALESTKSWVEVPKSLVFLGSERSFPVVVDPTDLSAGQSHFAEVLASVRHPGNGSVRSGPVFRVPITVLKPEALLSGLTIRPWENIHFAPGLVVRRFYESPCGATYAFVRVTAGRTFSDLSNASSSPIVKTEVRTADGISGVENGLKTCLANPTSSEANISVVSTTDTLRTRTDEGPRAMEDDEEDESCSNNSSKSSRHGHMRTFDLHVAQLRPQMSFGETVTQQGLSLYPGAVQDVIAPLEGQSLFELCLAQEWFSAGACRIKKVELIFGGVVPYPRFLHAQPGMLCFPKLEVVSHLPSGMAAKRGAMAISGFSLRAVLSNLQKTLPPATTHFQKLMRPDFITGFGPTYQVEIGYTFEMYESGKATLRFPSLNRTVYESELDGGPYVMVHRDGNWFVFSSDIYPRRMDLPKGEYTATVYLRHESMDVLESLSEMPMTVDYDLPSEITLDAFDSAHAACVRIDGRKLQRNTIQLEKGERIAVFLGVPKRSLLPKWAAFGDLTTGKLSVDKLVGEAGAGPSCRLGKGLPAYNITFSVGPTSSPKPRMSTVLPLSEPFSPPNPSSVDQMLCSRDNCDGTEERTDDVKSNADTEAENDDPHECEWESSKWVDTILKKARVKQLKTLLNEQKTDRFLSLYEIVKSKHGEDIDIMMLRLSQVDREACNKFASISSLEDIRKFAKETAEIADRIRGKLDPSAIAAHFAFNVDTSDDDAVALQKTFEKKRQHYIEASFRKARCLSLVAVLGCFGRGDESENEDKEKFETSMKELGKWVTLDGKGHMPGMPILGVSPGTTSDEDLTIVSARREAVRGRYGCALQVIDQFYGPNGTKRPEALTALLLKIDVLKELGWDHIAEREWEYRSVRFPKHPTKF